MSRSYRKHGWCGDNSTGSKGHRRYYKTFANRIVRRNDDIPSGGYYKKASHMAWNICDYGWYIPYRKEELTVYCEREIRASNPCLRFCSREWAEKYYTPTRVYLDYFRK